MDKFTFVFQKEKQTKLHGLCCNKIDIHYYNPKKKKDTKLSRQFSENVPTGYGLSHKKVFQNIIDFDLKKKFTELIFFEENDSMICEAGLWYYLSDESILTNAKKKSKKVGFFESFFNIFSK